jgi:hypothetical protein
MRCTASVAELILKNAVSDATLIRGFEHYNFIYSASHLAAHRVVFSRYGREDDSERLPIYDAPPTVPALKAQEGHSAPLARISHTIFA